MPTAILIVATVMAAGTTLDDWKHVERRAVGLGVIGRLPGTVLGTALVTFFPLAALEAVVGLSVLGAVSLSGRAIRFQRTDKNLLIAGAASGFTGTAAGIGGPPMALLYQNAPPGILRGTLGAFFAVGSTISLAALGLAGQASGAALLVGAAGAPMVWLGWALAVRTRDRLSATWLRRGVLALAVFAALTLLVRAAMGV
jgi:uncharacterized membrane protein YfcA